jgi:hypothetical protein
MITNCALVLTIINGTVTEAHYPRDDEVRIFTEEISEGERAMLGKWFLTKKAKLLMLMEYGLVPEFSLGIKFSCIGLNLL